MTSKGELVGANPTDKQLEGKATLTSMQKRNQNCRIRKMLEQLKEQGENEDVITQMAIKLKGKTFDRPVEVLPQPVKTEERSIKVEPYIPQFRLQGKYVNILEGLELHTNVFTSSEQDDNVEHVFLERDMGRAGRLRRTYSETRKWKHDCIPNSCIVNIYEAGNCIPPHVDHDDFVRPFCTVSFINKCNTMFETEIQIVGDGEF
ncbi:uncharacterized protein LOC110028218 [Phalaenopsis equestris]|uniref:uncharacterized protein LOC110028218 n=1 Tax=Phalaenopsis equestris TaxID=78828 RepID=UPI0009E2A2BF|nr:uncharacterized protein LOC110028218 [Phalaenopsis equestris]